MLAQIRLGRGGCAACDTNGLATFRLSEALCVVGVALPVADEALKELVSGVIVARPAGQQSIAYRELN